MKFYIFIVKISSDIEILFSENTSYSYIEVTQKFQIQNINSALPLPCEKFFMGNFENFLYANVEYERDSEEMSR